MKFIDYELLPNAFHNETEYKRILVFALDDLENGYIVELRKEERWRILSIGKCVDLDRSSISFKNIHAFRKLLDRYFRSEQLEVSEEDKAVILQEILNHPKLRLLFLFEEF